MAKKSVRLFGKKTVQVAKVVDGDAKALADYLKKGPIQALQDLSDFVVLQHSAVIIMSCEKNPERQKK